MAASSGSPQPSPSVELVKGLSGLEKVVLRGTRSCSVEVLSSAFPAPPPHPLSHPSCCVCMRLCGVCRGTPARGCDSFGFGCRVRRSGGNSADPRGVWAKLMRVSASGSGDFVCFLSRFSWIIISAFHDLRVAGRESLTVFVMA
jgi:hypothetical protein